MRIRLALLALALWILPPVAAQSVIFLDTFTEDTTNTALASHAPDTGSGWTEVIDTGGTTITAFQSTDRAGPQAGITGGRIVYLATPTTPCGADCDIQFTTKAFPAASTDRPAALVFGYVDTTNYCALVIYEATANPDIALVKVVAGTASDLASGTANTAPAVNDVWEVEKRGAALTLKKNTVSILTPTDAACNSGVGTGIGFGNIRTAGDIASTSWGVDDFTVTNQTTGGEPGGGGTGAGGGLLLRKVGAWLH